MRAALALLILAAPAAAADPPPVSVSGIYPSLAAFNGQGECGIGAVVPWAGRLWWLTYPPHQRHGSPDKLYSVGPDMKLVEHPESVGGTHACRLIHRESNQLLIGPYVIDAAGKVRAFDVKKALPGRLTAIARHLTDPANKVYFVDMEGPVWEADVHTLATKKLFEKPLPGWHGKGAYTAQGRLVVSNNGESSALPDLDKSKVTADLKAHGPEDAGVLGEWDGTTWRIVERRQFTDVTGPGGIRGNEKDTDPLWAEGWDKRSVILKLLDGGKWSTYRLPKGSYTFDPKHGWYTEWPRIREIGGGKAMMVMHGTMFDFPLTFSAANPNGIRPLATHLRYIPDFCEWDGKVVLAADDTSIMQNPLAGQSQSNLWFGTRDDLRTKFGPPQGWGGPWVGDAVKAGVASDPYLFAGYAQRVVHLSHKAAKPVTFTFEADGKEVAKITVPPMGYAFHVFPADAPGEWVRVTADKDCSASCYFHYSPAAWPDKVEGDKLFAAVGNWYTLRHVHPSARNRNLLFYPGGFTDPDRIVRYQVDEKFGFTRYDTDRLVPAPLGIPSTPTVDLPTGVKRPAEDAASGVLTDGEGKRYRLPRASKETEPMAVPPFREVQSERTMANLWGTFYEVPRADAPGKGSLDFKRLKPVSTHRRTIGDLCTWRGLLVIAGTDYRSKADGHYFAAGPDGPGLWFGAVDDLWRFGKPVGVGGPWKDSAVKAGEASDPYLMTNFDKKRVRLKHDAAGPVTMKIEIDFANRDSWATYQEVVVPPGEGVEHVFPAGFAAHWVRVTANVGCKATAWFVYE